MNGNEASARLARRIGLRHLKSHPDYPTRPGQSGMVEFYAMSGSDYFELAY
jgi:RimJ/RimL family protein N-acetyltransferase